MSILISWLGPLRAICMAIDGIAFSLLDQAYNIVIELSSARILEHDAIKKIMFNLYILFGVVAFFRLALVLVNSIIDPEKLNEKGKGLGNIFFRVVGMLIILGVTPFLFELSYDVQEKIVSSDKDKNVIFSLILGDDANIGGYDKDGYNAGKALQNVVLSSLITIDYRYLVNDGAVCTINENNQYVDSSGNVISDGEVNTKCGFVPLTCVPESDGKTCTMQGGYIYDGSEGKCDWKNCHNAVDKYNKMYVDEDMKPSSLAGSAGVSAKIDTEDGEKEEVYVYDYMFIVTSIAGVAMTWIILSFAIDIAVRMFELIVLEVLSPLFIATFVDPKSAQSGPFKNWLSAVGKSYASLYIKLAILALMTLLIMIVNQSEVFNTMRGEIAGFAKIFVIFGLLVFAKKAPKWIMDMIGIKGDGMGLYTPGKLKDAMLGGALAAKAGRGALAAGSGLLRGAGNHLRNKKAQRDAIADSSEKLGDKNKRREDRKKAFNNGSVGGWLSEMNRQRNARQEAIKDAKNNGAYKGVFSKEAWGQGMVSMGNGVGTGFTAGIKAENIKGALSSGKAAADNFKSSVGMQGDTTAQRIKSAAKDLGQGIVDNNFGDSTARRKEREARELEQLKSDYVLPQYRGTIPKGCVKQGDFSKDTDDGIYNMLRGAGLREMDDMVDAMAAMAINPKINATTLKGANFKDGELILNDAEKTRITLSGKDSNGNDYRMAGRVFNDAGIANAEQLYMNKASNVVSEREKLVSDRTSLQNANNSAFATNQQLRDMLENAFKNIKISMPGGSTKDLRISNVNELETTLKENRDKLAGLKEGSVEYNETQSLIDILSDDKIKSAFEQIKDNDDMIESNRTLIGDIDGEIASKNMNEMVEAAAKAAKASKFDAQGILDGLNREISKAGERKETKKKES